MIVVALFKEQTLNVTLQTKVSFQEIIYKVIKVKVSRIV